LPILLNNLTLRVSVLACKQELRGHVQGILRADIIALGAEDALGDIDADTLCFREELDGMGRADLQAERTADARLPVIGDLPPEFRGHRYGGVDGCLAICDLGKELCDRGREVAGREGIGGGFFKELPEQFRHHGQADHGHATPRK